MKAFLLSFTMVMACIVAVQPRAFFPDTFLQPQEQVPAASLQCFVCDGPTPENCTASQIVENCTAGLSCYTLQAFDAGRNMLINSKGCFPTFLCSGNQGCEMINTSRSGGIQSCSLSCCTTPLCNAAAPGVTPPAATTQPAATTAGATTTQAPTTTAAPTTTRPPTTAAVTTAPPITVVPPIFPQAICGGPLTPPSGFLTSPNYPLRYPSNAFCAWTVTVPRGSQLRLDFLFFDTEHCYDFVEIYVGRRLVRRLSGGDDDDDYDDDKRHYYDDDKCDDDDDGIDDLDEIDEEEDGGVIVIQGTGEMIRIVFRSDYSVTRRGFFARYNVVTPPPAVPCGGPLMIPSGRLTSPGFPISYPNNADCRWTITVPLGSSLVLDFTTFETERCRDYIQILQGWRPIRRLSGVYGRDDDDDDCDDDDDDDNNDDDDDDDCDDGDDDDDGDEEGKDDRPKWQKIFGFLGHRAGRAIRQLFGSPYVKRVCIRGTGEMVTIIFRSDPRITRRGFDAVYRVSQAPFVG